MLVVKIIVGFLGALVVVQTALSLIRSREWWVRMCDFPRAQIAWIGASLMVLFGIVHVGAEEVRPWEWVALGLLAAATLVQLWQILPYTRIWKTRVPLAPPGLPESRRFRLVISNVLKENRDFDRWLCTVRAEGPDMIVAVETDDAWDDALQVLATDYPHAIRRPQNNTYGMILYSRLPLHRTRIKHLLEADVPSIFTTVELPSGDDIRFVVLHPRPPRPDIQQDSVLRDGELVRAGRLIRSFRRPTVVAGDLNDVAWSHTTRLFLRLSQLMDPRVGRGRFSTYHADHRFLRYPLDHVFQSNHFDLIALRRLGHVGSDHFPILIELVLRPHDPDRPEAAKRQEDDEDEAIDAVQDARELRANETPAERRERKVADH